MRPLVLQGRPALSDFRIDTLLRSLRERSPELDIAALDPSFVYLVESNELLPDGVRERTYSLLDAVSEFDGHGGFFVTPRKGTISPWSSKATDIFHNCALTVVARVERGIHFRLCSASGRGLMPDELVAVADLLHDRMTEGMYEDVSDYFDRMEPAPMVVVDVAGQGKEALRKANVEMGLALSEDEIDYLYESYRAADRNPTDVELVMFGQVNSEHCRHKIFNADWTIDGRDQAESLFQMIRNTHEMNPGGTLVAYKDNSGVLEGVEGEWFEVTQDGSRVYRTNPGPVDMIMKVETHNHPTAISPYPGAATGVGGEIRDESATGRGSRSKAGLSAFMVSNLGIPDFRMPWERNYAEFPSRLATPLDIMLEGPIGGAGFGNEYGRPQLCGLFKTYEQEYLGRYRGYHKPIMVAGGMGNIKRAHVHKEKIPAGALIVQLGGPAMRIGLGGGAASSMATGSNAEALDFDSVQRDNAEMQRRCQEVIAACTALGENNPILSIHDLGAGGLSNGCPELVADTGGEFWLRHVHNEDRSMSPMEIWCCEAQERYVLAIPPESWEMFMELCRRERCEVAVIGKATGEKHLLLHDEHFDNDPIDIDIGVILGKPPRMRRDVRSPTPEHPPLSLEKVTLTEAVRRVLRLPSVSNKTFLITIADRSITGMVTRDQMTGPFQTPISDVAVTSSSYSAFTGEAMAMGERTAISLVCAPAAGRMAVGEAITNIAAAGIGPIGNIKLSANWMCACGEEGEDALLYETVRAVGMELCPELGICIPVGKDSLSMRTVWETSGGEEKKMTAPLSLVVSSFAPVQDVRKTVTPDLKPGASRLLLVDLGEERNRLGCSALAQVYNQVGPETADVDNPKLLLAFYRAIQELLARDLLLAYHDRSDGGLFVTLAEMAFGGRTGALVDIGPPAEATLPILFSEELGAVLQVAATNMRDAMAVLEEHGLGSVTHDIGAPAADGRIRIQLQHVRSGEQGDGRTEETGELFSEDVSRLNQWWSELTFHMQSLRDNPECAREEYEGIADTGDPGMNFSLSFDPKWVPGVSTARPPMAILREQGINGQVEMAAAFDRAGFSCVDVHMTDLLNGRARLHDFVGLVACGGFSYGDVLGAGSGWAKSILFNAELKEAFAAFFARPETFALGVCNGCQMISQLKHIIPGAQDWPGFVRNRSEQFEARYVTVEIVPSPSILFKGMEGSRVGVPVAHGEGRADFGSDATTDTLPAADLLCMRYVDNRGRPADRYPLNPNGSPGGVTGFTTPDGRVTIMMPHPERVFRKVQLSYCPDGLLKSDDAPWIRMFRNARQFVG